MRSGFGSDACLAYPENVQRVLVFGIRAEVAPYALAAGVAQEVKGATRIPSDDSEQSAVLLEGLLISLIPRPRQEI